MADVCCTVAHAPPARGDEPPDVHPDGPPGDDLSALGLRPIELADAPTFARYFATLADPLSDYTFAQIYTWRNSLHLAWTEIDNHLCVFANGCGDLTLLVPPIGDTGSDAALRAAADLMDGYNAAAGVPDRTRVEYASPELLARLDPAGLSAVAPMGTDYVYDTARMIDLAGGDLASKRQARNRFARTYAHRVEPYDPAKHLDGCLALLHRWHDHQDAAHAAEPTTNGVKRAKESTATELALRAAPHLGLTGLVVYAADDDAGDAGEQSEQTLRGFTFGEPLGRDQSSIVIEKTDLATKGLAQFIFSDFCRQCWADRPLCNVGDDWGLDSLAWTKMSYRPVRQLQKYALTPARRATSAPLPSRPLRYAEEPGRPTINPPNATHVRPATPADLPATSALESACFPPDLGLKPRQLRYLAERPSAVFLVAESTPDNAAATIVGDGIALVRRTGPVPSGRIYSLAVDAAHRGRHVGHRLLTDLVAELAARGVGRVSLEVDAANAPAIALYERLGFAVTGTLADYYGPGRPALRMARDLTPLAAAA